jgi:hypothetical protein
MKTMGPLTITGAGIQIVTSAASATGTIPFDAGGNVPRYIRVAATAAACVRLFPPAGGSAVNTDTQVQPGDSLILCIPQGITKISAIQQSAAGVVQVSPCENA